MNQIGPELSVIQPEIPVLVGAQQNCIGFALGNFTDGNPGPDHNNFEDALEWFRRNFNASDIQGGYRILYWPEYGVFEDSHWAD